MGEAGTQNSKTAAEQPSALLAQLADNPDDEALRERAAMALTHAGRHAEAVAVLSERLVNLTAHDGPTLPSLAKRYLQPELAEATAKLPDSDETEEFVRRFVVANGRVLYYWTPRAMADDPGLRHAIRSRLAKRLSSAPAGGQR